MEEMISLAKVLARAPAPWSMRPADAQHVELRDANANLICRTNASQALVGVLVEGVNELQVIGPFGTEAARLAEETGERFRLRGWTLREILPELGYRAGKLHGEMLRCPEHWEGARAALLEIAALAIATARHCEIETLEQARRKSIPF